MADIERVKRGIMICSTAHMDGSFHCGDCPYTTNEETGVVCEEQLCADALELIDAQQKEIRRLEEELAKRPDVVRCKDCEYAPGNELGFVCKIRDHFGAFMHDPDNFYCASGKNKGT